jgi:hypothetical protein
MASNKITIILSDEDDLAIKNMIKALRLEKGGENPYSERSESWIAKRILRPALEKEYKKYFKAQE